MSIDRTHPTSCDYGMAYGGGPAPCTCGVSPAGLTFKVTITPQGDRADLWTWQLDWDGDALRGEAHGTYDFARSTAESHAQAVYQQAQGVTSYTFNAAAGERT